VADIERLGGVAKRDDIVHTQIPQSEFNNANARISSLPSQMLHRNFNDNIYVMIASVNFLRCPETTHNACATSWLTHFRSDA
jgi:hypothetical protein